MSSSPLARASVPDLVFAEICQAILSGRYKPGDRLPTQRALAADMEVNMSSIREALGRLEQLRLVETRHGDATKVLDWRRSGGLEALALLGSADPDVIASLFEARRLLLREAARLAAERRTPEQARTLNELASAVGGAADDSTALRADWEFMSAVVESAGNLVFQLIMNSVRETYMPRAAAFANMVSSRDAMAPLYAETARAIDERDGDAAAEAIEALAGAQQQQLSRAPHLA